MSILQKIRNFNLFCHVFGHVFLEKRKLFSLRTFKETQKSVQVGSICECKRCGLETKQLWKRK